MSPDKKKKPPVGNKSDKPGPGGKSVDPRWSRHPQSGERPSGGGPSRRKGK